MIFSPFKKNKQKTRLQRTLTAISDAFFAAALVLGLFVIVKTYQLYSQLTPGTCPIDTNRPWMYLVIVLSVISLILSFVETGLRAAKK